MTKQEALKEIEKLCEERNARADILAEEAKAKGIYEPGLDGNRELYVDLDKEIKSRMKKIYDMVDEPYDE